MAITLRNPRTIILGGPYQQDNELLASAAITPGWLVEKHDSGGVNKWRKNASSTEAHEMAIAMDQPHLNKTIDDDYAAADQVSVALIGVGCTFWGFIPSGQDISRSELLQNAGTGLFITASATTAGANLARFKSLDAPGSVTVATRIRIERIN